MHRLFGHPAIIIIRFFSIALTFLAPSVYASNVNGTWSGVNPWPLISVHAVLLPDGRVLSYGTKSDGTQTGKFIVDVWDPSAGLNAGHLTLNTYSANGTDLFCSSQLVVPTGGTVFIAGGDNWTGTGTTNTGNNNSNTFDYTNNSLSRQNDMNRARWYSTSTVLTNGEIYIQGGSSGEDRPEVRQSNGSFRLLSGANTSSLSWEFPRNWLAPNNQIFGYDVNGKMFVVNPAGTGSFTSKGTISGTIGNGSSAVMYRPGRILQFGGDTNQAKIIDINGTNPVITATGSLLAKRVLVNASVLPNGRVLATGGSGSWNVLTGVTKYAEIWNPSTGTWTQGASQAKSRLYHSNSLLLPDATVMVGGGGAPGPENNTNMEIYYPPYLYSGAGSALAPRPSISAAPQVLDIGDTFPVDFADTATISKVVLIKTGSVTHSYNMDQRYMEATFNTVGSRLMVQAPTRSVEAPPGYYMLFLLDAAGVPSVARILQMTIATTPNPAVTPVLTTPANRTGPEGTPASLQLVATDPNGDALGYGASGLPTGLSINITTGLISGTPTTPGIYDVVVAASDGVNTATTSFVWTITAVDPLVLSPLPTTAPALAGSTVNFTAVVSNAINPQFRWHFDDGTPTTAWSSSPTINHAFSEPGVYYVTVTAVDNRGVEQVSTVAQTVHLPLTAGRPVASGNIGYESRAGNNDRVWVVNQDNDSVSVFDTVTGLKLAEIPVDEAPRTLAINPEVAVWVANKRAATISRINPATLSVAGSIALPRGSEPFGLVFAPVGNLAYVALEGTGQLLRIDRSTGEVTGQVDVGPNPRHVSVSADGASIFVSRFITPPLPGESTGNVQPGTSGGEVVKINAASMTVAQVITLHHQDKPDFENQGSGIPNYLGAAAISPDATQAFVPSKQDNIRRGMLRNGQNLNFQNTVRAISSRIDLGLDAEDLASRMDHDNASVASAAVFDPLGVYLFVTLETSREVAAIDAHGRWQVLRFASGGRAPQGAAISPDGQRLYVNNFMDRTVSVFDLAPLVVDGAVDVPLLHTWSAVANDRLPPQILLGKQLFYDAKDPRLARDAYMSCATCHNDGGQDGRVWDLTGMGEGLRNTISLRGRAGGEGFLHWSNNFDEVQDFEGQIRSLAGGNGLMSNTDFNAGTRSQPLGDPKAGLSADLDALAAYAASLNSFAPSPARNPDGTLTPDAAEGRVVFANLNCAACHGGSSFTISGAGNLVDVGTLKPASGQRLGGPLTGIDVPTLRDVWATAPYLHDGSAATLADAVAAHAGVTVPAGDQSKLIAYLQQIGSDESVAPVADADLDGVLDSVDNCPVNANPDQADADGDGVGDACDNCTAVANADQRDSNGDGYGNRCDVDLNGDGATNLLDLGLFKQAFGTTTNPDADVDGNGAVNLLDLGLFKAMFGHPPGPAAGQP